MKNRITKEDIALASLLLIAFIINMSLLAQALRSITEIDKVDWITAYENRFDGLKKTLPGYGTVGYVTNNQAEDIRYIFEESKRYYLAQYALAPIVLEYGGRKGPVVGNFKDPADGRDALKKIGLPLVRDFGNGVVLLEEAKR
ncbi:MAG: hypothetical protein WC522_05125 [Candidatus Omnitrophota bacterium]